MNIGGLLKNPAQLMGFVKAAQQMKLNPLPPSGRKEAFQRVLNLSASKDAEVFEIKASDPENGEMSALLVFVKKAS